jgi:hypothetical protein
LSTALIIATVAVKATGRSHWMRLQRNAFGAEFQGMHEPAVEDAKTFHLHPKVDECEPGVHKVSQAASIRPPTAVYQLAGSRLLWLAGSENRC